MDSVILFGLRIGLLVVLWLFILFALNSMRKDVKIAASSPNRGAGSGGSASSVPPAAHHGGMPQQMTIVDGPRTGSRMDLGDLTEITIGRAPDCDFLVSDDFASGRHARLITTRLRVVCGRPRFPQWHLCAWGKNRRTRAGYQRLRY